MRRGQPFQHQSTLIGSVSIGLHGANVDYLSYCVWPVGRLVVWSVRDPWRMPAGAQTRLSIRPWPFTAEFHSIVRPTQCLIHRARNQSVIDPSAVSLLSPAPPPLHVHNSPVPATLCRLVTLRYSVKWSISSCFAFGTGAKYCDKSVCMSVCLSVRSYISKTTCPNFLYMLPAAVARSSSDDSVFWFCEWRHVFR